MSADLRAATLYGSTSGGMEDTLAQKIELRAAVHAPLDQLEPVEPVPRRGRCSRARRWPRVRQPRLPEPGDEAAEIGRGCGLKPRRQSCGSPWRRRSAKARTSSTACLSFGAATQSASVKARSSAAASLDRRQPLGDARIEGIRADAGLTGAPDRCRAAQRRTMS